MAAADLKRFELDEWMHLGQDLGCLEAGSMPEGKEDANACHTLLNVQAEELS